MSESWWSLGDELGLRVQERELGVGGGLSPRLVMLMLVDTIYNPALLAKRASGPKHYFHFTKDRITTMEEKRGQGE